MAEEGASQTLASPSAPTRRRVGVGRTAHRDVVQVGLMALQLDLQILLVPVTPEDATLPRVAFLQLASATSSSIRSTRAISGL